MVLFVFVVVVVVVVVVGSSAASDRKPTSEVANLAEVKAELQGAEPVIHDLDLVGKVVEPYGP